MQNEENTVERGSVETEVKAWTSLKTRVAELVKETKASGKEFEGEILEEILGLNMQVIEIESRLRLLLRGQGIVSGISDPNVRQMIESLIERNRAETLEKLESDDEESRDPNYLHGGAAWDFVYGLGTPAEQYLNYNRTTSIVSLAAVPPRIHELLEEARICFATGQGNAVMALGRMILEFAITDIGVRIGRFPQPDSLQDFYKAYPPYERADKLLGTGGPRRDRFRKLYDAGSKTIHSSRESEGSVPLQFLEEVIAFVNNEYAINLRG